MDVADGCLRFPRRARDSGAHEQKRFTSSRRRDVDVRVWGIVHACRVADDRAEEGTAVGEVVVGRVAACVVTDDEMAGPDRTDAGIVEGDEVALDAVVASIGEDAGEETAGAVAAARVVDDTAPILNPDAIDG